MKVPWAFYKKEAGSGYLADSAVLARGLQAQRRLGRRLLCWAGGGLFLEAPQKARHVSFALILCVRV
jgi:hypothetical protein